MLGKFSADILQMTVAGIGGLISIMLRHEMKGVADIFWGVLGSAFAGKAVAWLAVGMGMNQDLTMFCVSVAGWVGATEAMKFFESQIRQRLDKGATEKGNQHE